MVKLRPLRTRVIVPVLILVAGSVTSYIGFRYSVEVGGAILGSTAGSLVTYIIQATQEDESWSREDQLFMAKEIYAPLNQIVTMIIESIEQASKTGDYGSMGVVATQPVGAIMTSDIEGKPRLDSILNSYWLNFADPKIVGLAKEISHLLEEGSSHYDNGKAFFSSPQFADMVFKLYGTKPPEGNTSSMHVRPRSRLGPNTDYAVMGPVFHESFMKEKVLPPSKWEDLQVVLVRPNTRDEVPADSKLDDLWSAAKEYGPYADEVSKTKEVFVRLKGRCEECRRLIEQKVREVFRP